MMPSSGTCAAGANGCRFGKRSRVAVSVGSVCVPRRQSACPESASNGQQRYQDHRAHWLLRGQRARLPILGSRQSHGSYTLGQRGVAHQPCDLSPADQGRLPRASISTRAAPTVSGRQIKIAIQSNATGCAGVPWPLSPHANSYLTVGKLTVRRVFSPPLMPKADAHASVYVGLNAAFVSRRRRPDSNR